MGSRLKSHFGSAFLWCAVLLLVATSSGRSQEKTGRTLYQRLGGEAVLTAVTADAFEHAIKEPQLARFFKGQDRKQRQESVANFLCAISEGPCSYDRVALEKLCDRLRINDEEFNFLENQLKQALLRRKVPDKEAEELMLQIENLRTLIIQS